MKLAELFVDIVGHDAPLNQTLAGVHRNLTGFAARSGATMARGIGRSFAANASLLIGGAEVAAVGLAAAVGAGFLKASQGASDLNEAVNKVEVVFGSAAGKITATADQMARDFGTPKKVILDAASNIGLIAKGAGYAEDKAADLGSSMAQLAADASSFYNVSLDVALEKIRSGMVGEAEPLRQFGVLLSEDAVKAEAARLGIAALGKELTESQKVAARVSLIQKGLADATGDLQRTQSGAANQTRQFWGQLENLKDTIGAELLPYFTRLVKASNDFLSGFTKDFGAAKERIKEFKDKIDETIFVVQNFGTVWEVAALDAQIGISKITGLFDQIRDKWDFVQKHITGHPLAVAAAGAVNPVGTGMAMAEKIQRPQVDTAAWARRAVPELAGGILKGLFGKGGGVDFKKLLPEELTGGAVAAAPLDVNKETDAIKLLRQEREKLLSDLAKKRAADLAAAGGAPPAGEKKKPAPAEEAVTKPGKERKAEFSDLASYAKKLQEGAFGKSDANERTAKWTEVGAHGIQDLIQVIKKPPPPQPGLAT